jgi:aspartyl-tRNA(Asn)/glutamyl-tRNA(Gln) amidotransferase subunit A
MVDLSDYSAVDLSGLLRCREIDAVELTEYFIDRIHEHNDPAIFIATSFERARREAAESAARYRAGKQRGLLDGIPIVWKDAIDLAGYPTTGGSAIYRHAPPAATDAPIVARLAAAGMVALGKSNLSEFAYSSLGLNPHFGTPRNSRAHDVQRAPGGSSSGSGVAVGAGLAPVAIGTDTGGSVRIPAAFNGVVGYKSSEGRYDRTGVFPLSATLDTVGVLAHSVVDCLVVDQALRGLPTCLPGDQGGGVLAALTLVAPENMAMDDLQPEVRANFQASLTRFEAAGAKVVWRELPELDEVQRLGKEHGHIAAAEAYCWHHDLLESARSSQIDPFVFRRIMAAKNMSAYDLLRLQQDRLCLRDSLWSRVGRAMIVMPTIAHVAPLLAPLQADLDYFTALNAKTVRNTLWGNMLNICALAVPNGIGEGKMPTSIVFNARAGHEDELLRVGSMLARLAAPPDAN